MGLHAGFSWRWIQYIILVISQFLFAIVNKLYIFTTTYYWSTYFGYVKFISQNIKISHNHHVCTTCNTNQATRTSQACNHKWQYFCVSVRMQLPLTLLWYHEKSYVNSTMGSIWPHCKKKNQNINAVYYNVLFPQIIFHSTGLYSNIDK